MKKAITILLLTLGVSEVLKADECRVVVFHAGSLSVPFMKLEKEFERFHPGCDVQREASGSRLAARKVAELGREADVVAVADYMVIEEILRPEFADWNVYFARNRMVIVISPGAKYADRINKNNWYKILLEPEVEYGRSDPLLDPCGYRTLLVWKLAEIYYGEQGLYEKLLKKMPRKNLRPKETDLLPLAQAGELDYHFNYLSVARQHHLKYLTLPEEIDLGSPSLADYYAQAKIELPDRRGKIFRAVGKPIVYGVTVVKNAPHKKWALKFLRLLLSERGRKILRESFQEPLDPPVSPDFERLPEELKPLVKKPCALPLLFVPF